MPELAHTIHWHTSPHLGGSVLILYPAPFEVMASALGVHHLASLLWQQGIEADIAYLHQDRIHTLSGRIPTVYRVILVSMAYELEILPLIAAFNREGIPLLAAQRFALDPIIIAGGAYSHINPEALRVFADVTVCGEADDIIVPLTKSAMQGREMLQHEFGAPSKDDLAPVIFPKRKDTLESPAHSLFQSPQAVFKDMFLLEIERGCPYRCAFCSLGFLKPKVIFSPKAAILAQIPNGVTKVGLIGAAVNDHPDLNSIVQQLTDAKISVSLSSLRANRLSESLITNLAKGGLQQLTIAADGLSQRIRDNIHKKVHEQQIEDSIALALKNQIRNIKMYVVVGYPDETEADWKEFTHLILTLITRHPQLQLSVSISPLVPKPHTPLANAKPCQEKIVKKAVKSFERQVQGRVRILLNSFRSAQLEYYLATLRPEQFSLLTRHTQMEQRQLSISEALRLLKP